MRIFFEYVQANRLIKRITQHNNFVIFRQFSTLRFYIGKKLIFKIPYESRSSNQFQLKDNYLYLEISQNLNRYSFASCDLNSRIKKIEITLDSFFYVKKFYLMNNSIYLSSFKELYLYCQNKLQIKIDMKEQILDFQVYEKYLIVLQNNQITIFQHNLEAVRQLFLKDRIDRYFQFFQTNIENFFYLFGKMTITTFNIQDGEINYLAQSYEDNSQTYFDEKTQQFVQLDYQNINFYGMGNSDNKVNPLNFFSPLLKRNCIFYDKNYKNKIYYLGIRLN